ncbi:hypothetical protein AAFC00_002997 [Neodothiora populina]|uniref:Mannosyltransferase n=1 Tax=Neodothiora populina TaxID=2781224 RepID=A0ABR3P977_9PEZI
MDPSARRVSLLRDKLFWMLLAFRVFNATQLSTFFQPDEYYQSLEPAWNAAFGGDSGASITWEWRQRLRSSLHPLLFAAVYRIVDALSSAFGILPPLRTEMLLAAPKLVQAVFAALTDYYTVALAVKVYGRGRTPAFHVLPLTVLSPWQLFCSTRTLSNSLETTLTAVALYWWPFDASLGVDEHDTRQEHNRMCIAFVFAAVATILRPTNIIIWLVVVICTAAYAARFRFTATIRALLVETKAAIPSGLGVVAVSVTADRLYYGEWTFPPLRFVHFNVVQSLAVFYGRNRPDYYITEGLPLLLTTSLPFAAWGIYRVCLSGRTKSSIRNTPAAIPSIDKRSSTLETLTLTILIFMTSMSLIAHKEVRFIYPLLPLLHVLSAEPFWLFCAGRRLPLNTLKRLVLCSIVVLDLILAWYICTVHQRGVLDVVTTLRAEYETHYLPALDAFTKEDNKKTGKMTVLFLMPCHSTPWRSHLVYEGIEARMLTCEPPIDVPLDQRATYLDEADVFYQDPRAWLRENMQDLSLISRSGNATEDTQKGMEEAGMPWPDYLVFFEQLSPVMADFLEGSRYSTGWEVFNTHWHDDWRRQGDVVVLKKDMGSET